jgi:hypothetical protein
VVIALAVASPIWRERRCLVVLVGGSFVLLLPLGLAMAIGAAFRLRTARTARDVLCDTALIVDSTDVRDAPAARARIGVTLR